MGGRGDSSKSFNTVGKDGFARTATKVSANAIALSANVFDKGKGAEPVKLVGYQKGDFMIHQTGGKQAITHIPSGALVHPGLANLNQAKSVVDSVATSSNLVQKLANTQFANTRDKKIERITASERETLVNTIKTSVASAKKTFPSTSDNDAGWMRARKSPTSSARIAQATRRSERIDI